MSVIGVHFIGAETDKHELENLFVVLRTGAQILSDLHKVDQLSLSVGVRVLRLELEDLHFVLHVAEAEFIFEHVLNLFLALFDNLVRGCQQRYVLELEACELIEAIAEWR